MAACEDFEVGIWGSVFVVCWKGITSAESAALVFEDCFQFANTRARGIGLLTLMGAQAIPPDTAARRVIANAMRRGADIIRASAVVLEGTGFQAAVARAVATGINLEVRLPYPHRVLSLEEAGLLFAEELTQKNRIPFDEEALPAAVTALKDEAARRLQHCSSWRPSVPQKSSDAR